MKWLLIVALFSVPCWGACVFNATTNNDWMTGSNWSGCAGAGGIPASTDAITTLNGNTATCASSSCTALSVAAANGASEIHVLSGGTVNIVGTAANTVNFSTPGNSIVVDSGGTFHACGGGATVRSNCLNLVGNATTQTLLDVTGTLILDQGVTMGINSLLHGHCGAIIYGSGSAAGYQLTPSINWTTPFAKIFLDCSGAWGSIPDTTDAVTACHGATTYGIICWDGNQNNSATPADNFQFSAASGALIVEMHNTIVIHAGTSAGAVFGIEGQAITGDHVLMYSPGKMGQLTANQSGTPNNTQANFNASNFVFRATSGTLNIVDWSVNDAGSPTGTQMVCDQCYWDSPSATTGNPTTFAQNVVISNSVFGPTFFPQNVPPSNGIQFTNDVVYQSLGTSATIIPVFGPAAATIDGVVFVGNDAATGNIHSVNQNFSGAITAAPNICRNLIIDGGQGTSGVNHINGYGSCNGYNNSIYNNLYTRIANIDNASNAFTANYGTMMVEHATGYDMGSSTDALYTLFFMEGRSGETENAWGEFAGSLIDGTHSVASRCTGGNTTICTPQLAVTCNIDTTANPAIVLAGTMLTVALAGCDGTDMEAGSFFKFNHLGQAKWLNGVGCIASAATSTSMACTLLPPYSLAPTLPASYSATETAGQAFGGLYLDNNAYANLGTGQAYNSMWNPGLNRTGYVMPFYSGGAFNSSLAQTTINASTTDTSLTVAVTVPNVSIGDWVSCTGDTQDNSAVITAVTSASTSTLTYNSVNSSGTTGLSHTTDCIQTTKKVQVNYPLWERTNGEFYGSGEGRGVNDVYTSSQFRQAGKYEQDFDLLCGGAGTSASLYAGFQNRSHWTTANPPLFVATPNTCYNVTDLQNYYWWNYTSMNPSLAHSAADGTDMGIQGRVYDVMSNTAPAQ
jgi:hypothetical protein